MSRKRELSSRSAYAPKKQRLDHWERKKRMKKKEKKKSKQAAAPEKNKKQSKKGNGKNKAKKTPADSIPYLYAYNDGIIETHKGEFSKSYVIPDINFRASSDSEQQEIAVQYRDMIGSFDEDTSTEITLYNRSVDIEAFKEKTFIADMGDGLDEYRHEYNKMIEDKLLSSGHNTETVRILTITIHCEDIEAATSRFKQIDTSVEDSMRIITKRDVRAMTIEERLDLLSQIYNGKDYTPLTESRNINGHEVSSFSLENCAMQGITTKDVIAPAVMEFKRNSAVIGSQYTATYAVFEYPTWISGTIMTNFADISSNALISVHFSPIDQVAAIKMLKRQGININSRIVSMRKQAASEGVGFDLISPDLERAKQEAEGLMDEMTRSDTKLYTVNFLITLIAGSAEELKDCEEQLKLIANRNILNVKPLSLRQEQGLNTSLPLGTIEIHNDRLMTSDTIASILPFNMRELTHKHGLYYGQNAITHNLLFYDRGAGLNPNSCILGMPGAGKSFAAKREMVNVILNTNDEIYIIDPEREYMPIANALGGSVIKIATGSNNFINPLDINLGNSEDSADPVKVKTDFIVTICDIMIGGKYGLSPIERALIDRCAMNVYEKHIKYLKASGLSSDPKTAPTLMDFYNELVSQPTAEAQNIALALERYVMGALDIFSHHTTVKADNRFMVYDIKDIGPGLKELGLQICLDNIWNRMVENKEHGKRTWIYIDEFYLMMQKPSSAAYIAEIWKRARKWDGRPCAITQNVEDMLKSEDARTIINNCAFVMMLGQSPINRQQLAKILNISKEEEKYIASARPGTGLIHIDDNNDNIPFTDSFPKDTKLYKIMTTKPEERL